MRTVAYVPRRHATVQVKPEPARCHESLGPFDRARLTEPDSVIGHACRPYQRSGSESEVQYVYEYIFPTHTRNLYCTYMNYEYDSISLYN